MLLGIESAKHGGVFQMFESNSFNKGRLNFKEHFCAGSVLTYCTHLPDTTLICNSQVVGVNQQGMGKGSRRASVARVLSLHSHYSKQHTN